MATQFRDDAARAAAAAKTKDDTARAAAAAAPATRAKKDAAAARTAMADAFRTFGRTAATTPPTRIRDMAPRGRGRHAANPRGTRPMRLLSP